MKIESKGEDRKRGRNKNQLSKNYLSCTYQSCIECIVGTVDGNYELHPS